MARRFARLRPESPPIDPGYSAVPADGMCLSVFLLLQDPSDRGRVLLGQVAADPRWAEVGALGADRVARITEKWMLPCRHLMLFEAPDDAARTIAREQLGLELPVVPLPLVLSESYARPSETPVDPHWDLHYVYRFPGPPAPPRSPLWRELRYLSVATVPRKDFARSHGDVLELAGLAPAP